jgi:phosphoserine phosphatase RsbU/P
MTRQPHVKIIPMCMGEYAIDAPITAVEVLRAYHHDEPLLFLSSAFITVAIVSAAFCAIRRRFDPLLIFLAMFAYLYGLRLRMTSEILWLTIPHSGPFDRLRTAVNYLVPIPAFAFFEAAGFLGRRGKTIVIALGSFFLALVIATFLIGPRREFDIANNIVIVIAIPAIAVRSYLMRNRDPELAILRNGLFCFIAGVLWDNIIGIFFHRSNVEPYTFAIFLASLGYVSARRLLRRDQELGEMRNELDLARRIQLSILPRPFPESASFRVAARYIPMTAVAGDFYDFIHPGPDSAGILVADVSGHGVPAALIASMVKMAAAAQNEHSREPAKLLAGMNTALAGNTQDQFVTAAYVHLDAHAREFRYAAAGHPPMLLLRRGHVQEVIENGFVLAMRDSTAYTQRAQALEPGDRLILYTDGILEARNAQSRLFGEEQLYATAQETADLSPTHAADRIVAAVESWSKYQEDDLTVIVCDFIAATIKPNG